jgi:hypothetical protein
MSALRQMFPALHTGRLSRRRRRPYSSERHLPLCMGVGTGRRQPLYKARTGSCPCGRQRSSAAQDGGYRITWGCPFKSPARVAQTGHQHRVTTVAGPCSPDQKKSLGVSGEKQKIGHDLTITAG